jgi:hypothetical protein
MKKKTRKISEIRQCPYFRNHIHLHITFDIHEVYTRYSERGLSEIWKRLTNSLIKYEGSTNRSWFKKLDVSGFYTYTINNDVVELQLFFNKKIDVTEFLSRLNSVCPIKHHKICSRDKFRPIETDTSLFGEYRLNK